jgi:phospholipid transport system transporter-binding protein
MSEAQLEALGEARYRLSGELSIDTVPAVLRHAKHLFDDDGTVQVDLGGVSRADSAGVALLVDWRTEAQRRKRQIVFTQVPPQMLAIARVSGVAELLDLK